MKESTEFFILRYSLIKENNSSLDFKELPAIKGLCVSEILKEDKEFKKNKAKYSFLGFTPVTSKDNFFESNRFWIGKIARLHKANLGEKIPGDIIEKEEDDWIASLVIIDTYSQYIIVNKNRRFGDSEQIIAAFQHGLSKPISEYYSYRIFVEAVIEKNAFWKIVKNHNSFFNLQLKIISPNILETNKKAREALEELQAAFRQEEMNIRLYNSNGKLMIPETIASDYINYIENGEGSWKLRTEDKNNPTKTKTHSSLDYIKTIPLSTVFSEKTKADIVYEILSFLNSLNTLI